MNKEVLIIQNVTKKLIYLCPWDEMQG